MSKYKKSYEPNIFYHVYNRGNRKGKIFFQESDYEKFLLLMKRFVSDYSLIIYSYCLMPNHYHILLNSGSSPGDITSFMHRFMTSYSMYFNKKYRLVGRVFQGTYRARPIYTLLGFTKVKDYINNNPIEAGLVKRSEDYRWLREAKL